MSENDQVQQGSLSGFGKAGQQPHRGLRGAPVGTPSARPADGRVFAYVGRQVGSTRLSDDDLQALALGGGGLMLSQEHIKVASRLRALGVKVPIVIDPACYFHTTTEAERQQLSLLDLESVGERVAVQSAQRVAMYLSPSAFVALGDVDGLQAVLTSGQSFCDLAGLQPHRAPAMVALPIDYRWLGPRHIDRLVDSVVKADVQVAVMPGGRKDPLESASAVQGFVDLLRAVPQPIAVLRTDLAGLGALAHGAAAASIGVSTLLRHVVPPEARRPFKQADPSPRVLVEPLLSWIRGSLLEQVQRDDGMLDCGCAVCHGRSLRRFGDPGSHSIREAALHSVLVWRVVADRLLGTPQSGRPNQWTRACEDALEMHARLRVRSQVDLSVPGYLSSWTALG